MYIRPSHSGSLYMYIRPSHSGSLYMYIRPSTSPSILNRESVHVYQGGGGGRLVDICFHHFDADVSIF